MEELVEKTPTATVQLEGPCDSTGRDLHIEESCDHLVALLLLLRPLWLTDEALDLDALVPVV